MAVVGLVLTTILILLGTQTQTPSGIPYQEFMALSKEQRLVRFARLDPVSKARIMRAHAERWLEQHRRRLSARQVALVEKAIAFLTPELYRMPRDLELETRRKALEAELQCGLRHSDMLEVLDPLRSPVPRASWLDDMWNWLELCFLSDAIAHTEGASCSPRSSAAAKLGTAAL